MPESTESWADLLRDCKRRGCVPRYWPSGTGAGVLGGVAGGFPETKEQRCWFHQIANVLAALPKSAHPAATRAMPEIFNAEVGDHARVAAKAFAIDYGGKLPKAVAKISDDLYVLLLQLPGRALDPFEDNQSIESTFATVRHRSKVTNGPGSRTAGLAMAFKLIEAAQARCAR